MERLGGGTNPTFHHPVFALTHCSRAPLVLEGDTTFTFVTAGAATAFGLNAGLVDEMEINLVPTLLGSGERLFDAVPDLQELKLVRTVPAPGVTHLKFARR